MRANLGGSGVGPVILDAEKKGLQLWQAANGCLKGLRQAHAPDNQACQIVQGWEQEWLGSDQLEGLQTRRLRLDCAGP